MIVKKPDGWYVMGHEGKPLGGPYDTEDEAKKRLAQVEAAKHGAYDSVERTVRYDAVGALRSPRRTDGGRLRADGVFTRAGIFEYRRPDGSTQRELRPPEEVFRADALASLEVLPVVEDHPRSGLLGSDSTRAQGWTLEGVRRDGDLVVGSLLATDPALVRAIEQGKRSLSVGYEVSYDPTPGTHPIYGRFDGVQRGIRGDHLAVVDVGRAGPEARVRMDSIGTFVAPPAPGVPSDLTRTDTSVKMTGKVDDSMTEAELKALKDALAAATARADAAEKSLREACQRADSAQGAVDTLKVEHQKALESAKAATEIPVLEAKVTAITLERDAERKRADAAEDPKRFRDAVRARAKLERDAGLILGDKLRIDNDDRTIMIAALEKVQGPVADRDSRSDDYIRARFDSAVEAYTAGESALRARSVERAVEVAAAVRTDSRSARQKMIDENRTLRPLGESK